jgi:hypothetical protein
MLRGKLPPEQFLDVQGNYELNKFSKLAPEWAIY